MVWKIILLVSLVPPIVVVVLRKWFCDRVLRELASGVTNQSGEQLARHLLRHFDLSDEVELQRKRRSRLVPGDGTAVCLSTEAWEGKGVVNLGAVASLVGCTVVSREHEDLWHWREWALRFGWAFPAFTVVVVVFAVVVAKLTAFVGIVIVVAAYALASLLLLATTPMVLEASKRAAAALEQTNALPRPADARDVARCCRAQAWRRVVPGALEWAVGGREKPPPNSLEAKPD